MNNLEFAEKVRDIAKHLNLTPDFEKYKEYHTPMAILSGVFDFAFTIANGGYRRDGRLVVRGIFPHTEKGESALGHRDEVPEITIDAGKPAYKVACEIKRRFYPAYEKLLGEVIGRVKESNLYAANCKANIRKIADYLGIEPNKMRNTIYAYDNDVPGLGGAIETYSDTGVKFSLRVSPDLAIKVFKLLKAEAGLTKP